MHLSGVACPTNCLHPFNAVPDSPSQVLSTLNKAPDILFLLLLPCPATPFENTPHTHRLLRALQEAKRTATKTAKEKHAAEVAAAELRGKAEAERNAQSMEVQMAQQQLEAARLQVARLEGDIKDYKARAQVRC